MMVSPPACVRARRPGLDKPPEVAGLVAIRTNGPPAEALWQDHPALFDSYNPRPERRPYSFIGTSS